MANINLLPWREKRREERKQAFFVRIGITIVIAVAILGAGDRYMASRIKNQSALNDYLKTSIASLDKEIAEIRQLQEQKKALSERMQVIQSLQGKRPVIVRLFDELVRTLPDGVYYNKVTRTDDTISIEGIAESNSRVSALIRSLTDSEWFTEPDLKGITALSPPANAQPGQDTGRNQFQLTVKITSPEDEDADADADAGGKK